MVTTSNLATAYKLPFLVEYHSPPLLKGSEDVHIIISLKEAVNQSAVDDIDALITGFTMLASIGALSGGSIVPWESTIEDQINLRSTMNSIEFILKGCNVDENSLVLLVQLFLMACERHQISTVKIFRVDSTANLIPLVQDDAIIDPYPAMWKKLPFPVNIDEDFYDSPSLFLIFRRPLTEDEQASIDGEILTWASAVAMGCYPIAPVPPEECSVIPDDEVVFIDEELEWDMINFRAHPSALNGLINVCAAIDHNIAPIAELNIE